MEMHVSVFVPHEPHEDRRMFDAEHTVVVVYCFALLVQHKHI